MEMTIRNPNDLIIIGVDVTEGPELALLDERITADLSDTLCADINERGVLQPVLCRRTEAGMQVVDGRRRVLHAREVNSIRAKQGLPLIKVPVVIQDMEDLSALEAALSLNCNRLAEDPIGLSFKIKQLVDTISGGNKREYPKALRRASIACNLSEQMVRNYVAIAGMASEAHDAFRLDKVSLSQLIVLASLDKEAQKVAVAECANAEDKSIDRARSVKDKLMGNEPVAVTTPTKKLIKDMLLLASFDAKDGVCSAQQLPAFSVDFLKWFSGETGPNSVPGLQELMDRATSPELREMKKEAKNNTNS